MSWLACSLSFYILLLERTNSEVESGIFSLFITAHSRHSIFWQWPTVVSSFVTYCQIYSMEFCTDPGPGRLLAEIPPSPAPNSASQPFALCLSCKTPCWDSGLSSNVWDTRCPYYWVTEKQGWNEPLLLVCKVLKL